MKEYILVKENDSLITIEDMRSVNEIIENYLHEKVSDINNKSRRIRNTYGVNGNAIHIYYGEKDTRIFLPLNQEDSIKKNLDSKLKFREIQCQ